jgi:hypothetical protein
MGTQTGPNRLVGNADYPDAGAYALVRRADTGRVEQPQTRLGLIRTWCPSRTQSRALLQPGPSSVRCKACAHADSDGPAFDLSQDATRIVPVTPFARNGRPRGVLCLGERDPDADLVPAVDDG